MQQAIRSSNDVTDIDSRLQNNQSQDKKVPHLVEMVGM
jgi:hypothetical protein